MATFKKVMLIDEDATNNLIFKKLASSARLADEIVVHISALDALDELNDAIKTGDELPQIIFLDIKMPIMNGWEFMDEFKKIKSHFSSNIDVYILSTSNNASDFERAKQYEEIKKYLVKPLSLKILKAIQAEVAF